MEVRGWKLEVRKKLPALWKYSYLK